MLLAPTTMMRCRVEQLAIAVIGSMILSLTPEVDIIFTSSLRRANLRDEADMVSDPV